VASQGTLFLYFGEKNDVEEATIGLHIASESGAKDSWKMAKNWKNARTRRVTHKLATGRRGEPTKGSAKGAQRGGLQQNGINQKNDNPPESLQKEKPDSKEGPHGVWRTGTVKKGGRGSRRGESVIRTGVT